MTHTHDHTIAKLHNDGVRTNAIAHTIGRSETYVRDRLRVMGAKGVYLRPIGGRKPGGKHEEPPNHIVSATLRGHPVRVIGRCQESVEAFARVLEAT